MSPRCSCSSGDSGEYIGSVHTQVLNRPLVIEAERINFDRDARNDETGNAAQRPFQTDELGPVRPPVTVVIAVALARRLLYYCGRGINCAWVLRIAAGAHPGGLVVVAGIGRP